jgi:hypothetical protein
MRLRLLIGCWLAVWVGCGKQPAPPPSAAQPSVENAARPADSSTVVTQAEASAVAPDEARMAAVLGELTQVVRKYSVERRRVPKTLEELVANGYLTRIPPAPTGKKFAITKDLQVQLVKR